MSFISIGNISTAFSDTSSENLQNFLDKWRVQKKVTGVIILIKVPAKQDIFTSGTTQLNNKDPITKNTLFAVGSITKTFTSAMILRLEADGKLNINDKIGHYFPEYPRWKNITIKQLLNMTSGIENYTENKEWVKNLQNNFTITWTTNELINIAYQEPDYFKPGKGWHYSNTNYVLLGKIIEAITHQPLSQSFQAQFFQPLGLKNTYFNENYYSSNVLKRMAHGYDEYQDVTTTILAKNLSNIGPAGGGMVMDSVDLESWINHLLIIKDILPPKQLEEMLDGVRTPPNKKIDLPNSKYGLGIGIAESNKLGKMISYAGTFPGYGSTFIYLPKFNTLIITQMNVDREGNDESSYLHFPNQSLIQGIINKEIAPI